MKENPIETERNDIIRMVKNAPPCKLGVIYCFIDSYLGKRPKLNTTEEKESDGKNRPITI